ncbi:MAG: DNA replication and repair protein RecF [Actinomycetota bacterium]
MGGPCWRARRLEVADLRPWTRLAVDLPDGCVALVGPNGAGKTSLLEALTLACLGVSPRTTREAEAVRRGAEALHVTLDLDGPGGARRREIGVAPGVGRRLRLDGEPVRGLGAWRAPGAVLVFLPEELRAVKGPPAARRRHLDRLLEAAVPGYAAHLGDYATALTQRNALLRRVRAGVTGAAGLGPWETQMARAGAALVAARRRAVQELRPVFAAWLARLGGGDGGDLRLEHSPADVADVADGDLEAALLDGWQRSRDVELRAGHTLRGPHRDDLWIGAGAADLRSTGSQGEQRTAVLALVLAHRDHLSRVAACPVLLLDDALSELDPRRRGLVLEAVSGGGQALVTSADPQVAQAALERGAAVLEVGDGTVRRAPAVAVRA